MSFITKKCEAFIMHAAERVLRTYEPGIIAVTGGIGKTTTLYALASILADIRSVRITEEAIPLPLRIPCAILGIEERMTDRTFWIRALWKAFKTAYMRTQYPELLILECPEGESHRFVSLARPQITVVTALGNANETDARTLLNAIPSNGYAVVNYDDKRSRAVALSTRARTITFGFEEGADLSMHNLIHRHEKTHGGHKPAGISYTATYGNQSAHMAMDNAFGAASAYAAAAALCVGTAFGLHLARTAETIRYLEMPKGRMSLSIGKKGTYVLNDSTATTEEALHNALETILGIPARRVIGVFGTAQKTGKEWRLEELLNRLALKACDAIITVGTSPINVDSKKKLRFDNGEAAAAELQAIIERDDLILVTGQGLDAVIQSLCSHRLVA